MMPHALPQPNGRIPMLGQQRQQAEAGIQQAAQQLSLGIYARIAAEMLDPEQPANPEHLRHLAKQSMLAARCYFEGIGVIQRTAGPEAEGTPGATDTQQTPAQTTAG